MPMSSTGVQDVQEEEAGQRDSDMPTSVGVYNLRY